MRLFMSMRGAVAVDNGQGRCFSGDSRALAWLLRIVILSVVSALIYKVCLFRTSCAVLAGRPLSLV